MKAARDLPGLESPAVPSELLRELREGLARTPREIPCKYFYDERGSLLFEEICRLDEYYPTRTEHALLSARAADIVRESGAEHLAQLVELGSGAATKTLALLHEAARQGASPHYVAVDISSSALERTRQIVRAALPDLAVDVLQVDYTRELPLPPRPPQGRRLALFLGGTIGNDEDPEAVALLSRVQSHLAPGDALLLGLNLVTDPNVVFRAYNDARGVTAEFNRNCLHAVNRVAGSAFDPDAFDHFASYSVEQARIEMWLVSRRAQTIELGALGGTLSLQAGEGIRTEISRRFRRSQAERLLQESGYDPRAWFESPDGRFGLSLAVRPAISACNRG